MAAISKPTWVAGHCQPQVPMPSTTSCGCSKRAWTPVTSLGFEVGAPFALRGETISPRLSFEQCSLLRTFVSLGQELDRVSVGGAIATMAN